MKVNHLAEHAELGHILHQGVLVALHVAPVIIKMHQVKAAVSHVPGVNIQVLQEHQVVQPVKRGDILFQGQLIVHHV